MHAEHSAFPPCSFKYHHALVFHVLVGALLGKCTSGVVAQLRAGARQPGLHGLLPGHHRRHSAGVRQEPRAHHRCCATAVQLQRFQRGSANKCRGGGCAGTVSKATVDCKKGGQSVCERHFAHGRSLRMVRSQNIGSTPSFVHTCTLAPITASKHMHQQRTAYKTWFFVACFPGCRTN